MRTRIGYSCLAMVLAAGLAAAQESPKAPGLTDMYCSGVVSTEAVPHDTYLISGEESHTAIGFRQGNLVYINRGSDQGVKVGDEFLVSRPVHELLQFKWFTWQPQLMRAMGTTYEDEGMLRVVNVHAKVSTAEITFSCGYMQRGDIVRPFVERPAPPYKAEAKFDRFSPPSGQKTAMVVTTKGFGQLAGFSDIVYVNLGSAQGVKVGDYFRIFRYQGSRIETAYQSPGTAYTLYGFGSTPVAYQWKDLPREILGEGIVLRVGPNASTVFITVSLREIYVGDYVEIE